MEHLELVDRVYLKVKQMIFDQELKPGQKLLQEKLSAQLGISRSPLLKALQRLESELLVEQIPRRGMFVKKMTEKEVLDVFQCRSAIEGLSARLAASRITTEEVDELYALFQPFTDQEEIDMILYAKTDRAFHTQVMNLSGNQVIRRLEMLSNIHLNAYQAGLLRPPKETLSEHLLIIEALEQHDPDLAEERMREHIERSTSTLKSKMNN